MNSKQLANVLIKMLGLSVCIHAIPNIIPSLIVWLRSLSDELPYGPHNVGDHTWAYLLGAVVEIALAVFLILRSECVADRLFPNEAQTRATPPATS